MIIRTCALAIAVAVLTATTGLAATVTLNVVDGQLRGASNVDVNGTLYDVEFLDGSCVALFDGCDSTFDFDFSTRALAEAAAISLGDTVFLDGPLGNFDSNPTLTFGIAANVAGVGIISIPYALSADFQEIKTVIFVNTDGLDGSADSSSGINTDLSNADGSTFARFTPVQISAVPLPAGAVLLLTGLAGLGALGAQRKKIAAR